MTGMLGGILFADRFGGTFDACAKQWRLFADMLNNVGMAVELAAPLLAGRHRLLLVACLMFGSAARSVVWVAATATRAALTLHFARAGNAADLAAKEQSQETATTMVGMVAGMVATAATRDNAAAAWLLFAVLTWLHVVFNIRAVRALRLASLNVPRLQLLLREYRGSGVSSPGASRRAAAPPLDGNDGAGPAGGRELRQRSRSRRRSSSGAAGASVAPPPADGLSGAASRTLSPTEAAAAETLLAPPVQAVWTWLTQRAHVTVAFGVPLSQLLSVTNGGALILQSHDESLDFAAQSSVSNAGSSDGCDAAASAAAVGGGPGYLLCLHRRRVLVVVQKGSASDHRLLLRAYVHAQAVALAAEAAASCTVSGASSRAAAAVSASVVAADCQRWMAGGGFERFLADLQDAGWQTDRVSLPRPDWTATWEVTQAPAAAAGRSVGSAGNTTKRPAPIRHSTK